MQGAKVFVEYSSDPHIRGFIIQHLINRGAKIIPDVQRADIVISDSYRSAFAAKQIILLAPRDRIEVMPRRLREQVHLLSLELSPKELDALIGKCHTGETPA